MSYVKISGKVFAVMAAVIVALTVGSNKKNPVKISRDCSDKVQQTTFMPQQITGAPFAGSGSQSSKVSEKSTGKAKINSEKEAFQKAKSSGKTVFYPLTKAERDKIERVIMTSCGSLDNSEMAKANAQVILDRVKDGRFGKNVDEVLDAPHQFEIPWKGSVNDTVKQAVRAVFDRGERVTQSNIFYYENPNLREVDPEVWRKGKTYVMTVGYGKYIHEYWTNSN